MNTTNSVTITGRLLESPIHSVTATGHHVANFRLLVSTEIQVHDKVRFETVVVPCVLFGPVADTVKVARSGTMLTVTGRLQHNSWTNKESGMVLSRIQVCVDKIVNPVLP